MWICHRPSKRLNRIERRVVHFGHANPMPASLAGPSLVRLSVWNKCAILSDGVVCKESYGFES